ncbi:hypothetical protein LRS13_01845 [Svornostia abyssi]|uniref:Uncharacterized protein n=1 Tax=Svornostia abyssi TaxID=2898438 RepID=A0ABY5PHZ8_9ACTN|nr:hypothetical protein LRS13_01845 [Parviterribacteraceae bacterium J379]
MAIVKSTLAGGADAELRWSGLGPAVVHPIYVPDGRGGRTRLATSLIVGTGHERGVVHGFQVHLGSDDAEFFLASVADIATFEIDESGYSYLGLRHPVVVASTYVFSDREDESFWGVNIDLDAKDRPLGVEFTPRSAVPPALLG